MNSDSIMWTLGAIDWWKTSLLAVYLVAMTVIIGALIYRRGSANSRKAIRWIGAHAAEVLSFIYYGIMFGIAGGLAIAGCGAVLEVLPHVSRH